MFLPDTEKCGPETASYSDIFHAVIDLHHNRKFKILYFTQFSLSKTDTFPIALEASSMLMLKYKKYKKRIACFINPPKLLANSH